MQFLKAINKDGDFIAVDMESVAVIWSCSGVLTVRYFDGEKVSEVVLKNYNSISTKNETDLFV